MGHFTYSHPFFGTRAPSNEPDDEGKPPSGVRNMLANLTILVKGSISSSGGGGGGDGGVCVAWSIITLNSFITS